MILTNAQKQTLANHIRSNLDPAVVDALTRGAHGEISDIYNQESSFIIWRESIEPSEYKEALVWTEVDGLQAGKARIWEWLTEQMTAPIDASSANVRQGLSDVFPQSTRGNLLAIAKTPASLAQSIFATGDGTTSSPGTLVVKGKLTTSDVGDILNNF